MGFYLLIAESMMLITINIAHDYLSGIKLSSSIESA